MRATVAVAPERAAARWSREWTYFIAIVCAWCFTPLVRRLLDFRAGAVNPVQIASLAPFLLLLPLAWWSLRSERIARLTPFMRAVALTWCATFAYGLVISLAVGSVGAAAYECVEYLVPMFGGLWLATQDLPADEVLRRVCRVVFPCAGIVAVYGLVQWVQPPPWDAMWVKGSDFISIGDPTPFAMRVFSTLNSPGTAADFFALTIVLALPTLRLRRPWMWAIAGVLGAALLLTLVREAWVALIAGSVVYLALSPRRTSAFVSIACCAVLLGFLITSLPGMLGSGAASDVIVSRLATFGDIDHDGSALDRQDEYGEALAQSFANPLGGGLGTVGAAAKLQANAQSNMIGTALDSGYFARLVELGWAGVVGYLAVTLAAPLIIAGRVLRSGSGASAAVKIAAAVAVSMCAVLATCDAANDAHFGLEGFFFWIALGVGSLALRACVAPGDVRAGALRHVRTGG